MLGKKKTKSTNITVHFFFKQQKVKTKPLAEKSEKCLKDLYVTSDSDLDNYSIRSINTITPVD